MVAGNVVDPNEIYVSSLSWLTRMGFSCFLLISAGHSDSVAPHPVHSNYTPLSGGSQTFLLAEMYHKYIFALTNDFYKTIFFLLSSIVTSQIINKTYSYKQYKRVNK